MCLGIVEAGFVGNKIFIGPLMLTLLLVPICNLLPNVVLYADRDSKAQFIILHDGLRGQCLLWSHSIQCIPVASSTLREQLCSFVLMVFR